MPAKALRGQKLADELLRVAKIFEGKYRQAFLRSVINVVRDQNLIALINDIESGKFTYGDSIDARLASVAISVKEMETLTSKAMVSSAKITNQVMSMEGSFNVVNDAFVEAAKNLSINLSTSISNSARQSLRGVIEELVSGAIPKSEALRRIMLEVGLLPTHAIAVRNYRATLLGSGTPMPKVKTLTEAYTKRLLKYRADMIARTEVARSIGIGQTEFWKQMQAQGFLPPDANRVWITSIDEKTCEFCGPMNGLVASIGGGWQTSKGYLEYPQASHPHCRCSAGITMSKPKKSQAIYKLEELEWQKWVVQKGESAGHPFRGNQWVTGFRNSGSTATLSKKYGKDFSSVSAYCKKTFGVRIITDRYMDNTEKEKHLVALGIAQGLDFVKESLTPTAYKQIVSSGVKDIRLVERIFAGPTPEGIKILGWFWNGHIQMAMPGLLSESKNKVKRQKLFSVVGGMRQTQTANVGRLIATATATIIHEIGHSAHRKLGIENQKRYEKKIGGAKGKAQGLTVYATTNLDESFAESFTARILLGKKFSALKHSTVPIFEESTGKVFKSEMQITTIQNLENVMEWIDAQEIANSESLEKGESAGHPFRGNQHTKGIGSGIKWDNLYSDRATGLPDIREELEGYLTPQSIQSLESWVNDSKWPKTYLSEVNSEDYSDHYDVLQSRLLHANFPEMVTITRMGTPNSKGNIKNGSAIESWSGGNPSGVHYGLDTKVFVSKVPRKNIVGVGSLEEGEFFYTTAGVITSEITKGESAGHPFRGNQWTRGVSGGGKPQSAPDTVASEFLRHSGYDVLPKPTSDLRVAKTTGAPISWLMPESLHPTLVPLFAELRASRNTMSLELKGAFEDALENLGFTSEEVERVVLAFAIRANLLAHNGGEKGGNSVFDRSLPQTPDQKSVGDSEAQSIIKTDSVPAIMMSGRAFNGLINEGRYKTQFETNTSGGVINTKLRASQETAMLSLHPSVNPRKRPVYGFVFDGGTKTDIFTQGDLGQYGSIVVVLKPQVRSRTSWTEGDSLNQTVLVSRMDNPTYHGVAEYSGALSWSPIIYKEAQIHGGVTRKDIDYVVMPRYFNSGGVEEEYTDKIEFAQMYDIPISQVKTWNEAFSG